MPRFRSLVVCAAVALSTAFAACPHGFSANSRRTTDQLRTSARSQELLDQDGFEDWEGSLPMTEVATDSLVQANSIFRRAAKLARDPVDNHGRLLAPKSVLFVEGDYFVLRRNGKRSLVEATTPELVHNLKMASHVPVGLFSLLMPHFDPDVPAAEVAIPLQLTIALLEARAVYEQVRVNATALSLVRFLDEHTLERQRKLVNDTVNYIDSLLAAGVVSFEKVKADFVDVVSAPLAANVRQATRAHIDSLRRVLTRWEAEVLSKEEKDSLRIVIALSHMAKPGYLVTQFFSRWYGVSEFQSERMIVMEGVYDERTNVENLALHVHDRILAGSFLGDDTALHRDLLSDTVREYLTELFGPAPPLRQLPGFPAMRVSESSTPVPSDTRKSTGAANSKRERTLLAAVIVLSIILVAVAVERCIAFQSRKHGSRGSIDFAVAGGPEYARFGEDEDRRDSLDF